MNANAEFLIHSEHKLMEQLLDLEKRGLLRLEALPSKDSVLQVRVSEISKAAAAELLAKDVKIGSD